MCLNRVCGCKPKNQTLGKCDKRCNLANLCQKDVALTDTTITMDNPRAYCTAKYSVWTLWQMGCSLLSGKLHFPRVCMNCRRPNAVSFRTVQNPKFSLCIGMLCSPRLDRTWNCTKWTQLGCSESRLLFSALLCNASKKPVIPASSKLNPVCQLPYISFSARRQSGEYLQLLWPWMPTTRCCTYTGAEAFWSRFCTF